LPCDSSVPPLEYCTDKVARLPGQKVDQACPGQGEWSKVDQSGRGPRQVAPKVFAERRCKVTNIMLATTVHGMHMVSTTQLLGLSQLRQMRMSVSLSLGITELPSAIVCSSFQQSHFKLVCFSTRSSQKAFCTIGSRRTLCSRYGTIGSKGTSPTVALSLGLLRGSINVHRVPCTPLMVSLSLAIVRLSNHHV